MDVKFDADAAMELISRMDSYCAGIAKEARGLLSLMKDDIDWKDSQKKAFEDVVNLLAHDMNDALSLESEYMRTFHKRVIELRG